MLVFRLSFRSFMVQRDRWDTYWGAEKIIFLIRDIDGPTMTAASVESCRFVAQKSPWGCLGSVLDVRNRLRRMVHSVHAELPGRLREVAGQVD